MTKEPRMTNPDITDEQRDWLKSALSDNDRRPAIQCAATFEWRGRTWLGTTDSFQVHAVPHDPIEGLVDLRGDREGITEDFPDIPAVLDRYDTDDPQWVQISGPFLDYADKALTKRGKVERPIEFAVGDSLYDVDGERNIVGKDIPAELHYWEDGDLYVRFASREAKLAHDAAFQPDWIDSRGVNMRGGPVWFNLRKLVKLAALGPIRIEGRDELSPWIHCDDERLCVIMPVRV